MNREDVTAANSNINCELTRGEVLLAERLGDACRELFSDITLDEGQIVLTLRMIKVLGYSIVELRLASEVFNV